MTKLLPREEYVEQVFFFQMLLERITEGYSTQVVLQSMKNELLRTTNLPKAVDFLLAELKLHGVMHGAMKRMPHYFTPFQTFLVQRAEQEDKARFDFRVALRILEKEAAYRAGQPNPQGIFFFQFEALSRNRLGFDYGLEAISLDPLFNEDWCRWINVTLRRQIGVIDLQDLVYVRSDFYVKNLSLRSNHWNEQEGLSDDSDEPHEAAVPLQSEAVLFGEQEGRIAWASRRRDPALFFAALSRHLGYPEVPHARYVAEKQDVVPLLKRRIELLENKLTLLEEELRGGINLERFYVKGDS